MDRVFFERQEGMLCAQHALNMLLQGAYFTAVELAEIALQLDEQERSVLTGAERANFRSQNMDDSGYFSVQVIEKALGNWNLLLIPITRPNAVQYREDPTMGKAYICNLHEHWFTVRKFGRQWIILNSIKSGPEMISDTYMKLYFEQLIQGGYHIFLIEGDLSRCDADDVFESENPPRMVTPPSNAKAARPKDPKEFRPFQGAGNVLGAAEEYDADLAEAIALSLSQEDAGHPRGTASGSSTTAVNTPAQPNKVGADLVGPQGRDEEDQQLRLALQLSMQDALQNQPGPSTSKAIEIPIAEVGNSSAMAAVREIPIVQTGQPFYPPTAGPEQNKIAEDVRMKRLGFLERLERH